MSGQKGPHNKTASASSARSIKPVAAPRAKKQPKKRLILGAFVALLVILFTAAGALTYRHFNNKPEKVLADALANTVEDLTQKKSSGLSGTFTFAVQGDNPLTISLQFDSKLSDASGEGQADIAVDFLGKAYHIKASALAPNDEEAYIKLQNLRETFAALVANHPEFTGYSNVVEPFITKFDDRWIKITKEDFAPLGLTDEQRIKTCATALKSLVLSGADKAQLKKIFKANQFMVAGEQHAGGGDFHYKLDFNKVAAQNFLKQAATIPSFAEVKTACAIDEESILDNLSQENGGTNQMEPVVELWVSKKTRRPTKFQISANDKNVATKFDSEVKLGSSEAIEIEQPQSSVPVQELKAEFKKIFP